MANPKENILKRFGGSNVNDLSNILKADAEDENSDNLLSQKSPYIDISELSSYLRNCNGHFSVLSLNTQSIRAKFDQLLAVITELTSQNLYFSAICLQETWQNDTDNLSIFNLPNYHMVSQGKICSGHGGLITYIHNDYTWIKRNLGEPSDIWEGLFLDISSNEMHKKITLGNIYKPPRNNNNNNNIETFTNQLSPIISQLEKENSYCLIAGDYNMNLLQLPSRDKFADFFDMMCTSGFFPQITYPTHFTRRSCTLIDQIYCHSPHNVTFKTTSSILVSAISDHFACCASLHISRPTKSCPKYIIINSTSDKAMADFRNELSNINLFSLISNDLDTDPNLSYEPIHTILTETKDKNMPRKTVKYNRYKHKLSTWITTGIVKSIKYRDTLYKKLKILDPDTPEYDINKTNLDTYNKILKKNIRMAKQKYYKNEFDRYKNDIKKTWECINNILQNKKSKQQYPKSFLINGTKISDRHIVADKFNKYFTLIGPELATKIDSSNKKPFDSYLTNRQNLSFEFEFSSPEIVAKAIDKLKPKTSCGHDNISSKLLKFIKDIISGPISIIINQSLKTGIFPNKLKIAKVLPLFKKGENELIENYRPISLLPSISKIFERIVFDQLYKYLDSNNLLYKSQYGFRKKHSTEMASLELIDRIYHDLDNKKIPIAIFLDLSKAFDTLDHNILLHKLNYYGVNGNSLSWFNSYLTNRYQYVDIDGTSSKPLIITTGVPQGSILGPLLFIIYMNDIYSTSSKFKFILYADDSTLYSPICSFSIGLNPSEIQEMAHNINKELKYVTDWLNVNKLSLNASKTKFMIFHFRQKDIPENEVPKIKIHDMDIVRTSEFNFLGLIINDKMNWKTHTKHIANKISRSIGILNKMKHFLPLSVLKTMYNSLILSHFTFCITAWGFESSRLFKLQKKAVRIITGSKYNAHTEPLFKENSLLKLDDIFKLQCLKLYHKYQNNNIPLYFQSMFSENATVHFYNTRQNKKLHIQGTRTRAAAHCIRHYIPKLMYEMPLSITEKLATHSYEGFSIYVKKFFILKYSTECTIPHCFVCDQTA